MTHFRVLFEKYDWDIEVCIIVENPNVQYILSRLEGIWDVQTMFYIGQLLGQRITKIQVLRLLTKKNTKASQL